MFGRPGLLSFDSSAELSLIASSRVVFNSKFVRIHFTMSTSTKLKFCANLSFLFTERESVFERYAEAKKAGLHGVEIPFPYDLSVEKLVQVKDECGIEQILINSYPGNLQNGDFGLAAIPGREAEFQASLELSLRYCQSLDCKRLHIMSGKLPSGVSKEDGYKTLEKNLRHAIPFLENDGVVGLIEPINHYTIPGYFLDDFDTAISLVKSIDSPNIRLQLDVFHLQIIHGNLTRRITDLLPYTGHIQIAQSPHRGEMDSAGEINYEYILGLLKDLGYAGWIGLEYKPSSTTVESFNWVQKYKLDV